MSVRGDAIVVTGPTVEGAGPLTRTILDYTAAMEALVPTATTPDDWAPLAAFVAVDDFVRVGTFLEVQDWPRYTEMLTRWASTIGRFETTVHRIAELPGLVYYEIEERHFRGEEPHVVNSLTVFRFDGAGKIDRLDVFLQQA
jgi:hypothetical protein